MTSPLRGVSLPGHVLALAIMLLTWAPTVFGDDWLSPKARAVFSPNGEYFVRIVPGQDGRNVGPAEIDQAKYGRGEFYVRQPDRSYRLVADVALQNPVAPVQAVVTDQGNLITFDNWFQAGYGKVVATYTAQGTLIRAWTLDEIYSQAQLSGIQSSVSSRWWRCSTLGFFGEPDVVYVAEALGGAFRFHAARGSFEYHPGTSKCEPATALP